MNDMQYDAWKTAGPPDAPSCDYGCFSDDDEYCSQCEDKDSSFCPFYTDMDMIADYES